MSLNKFKMGTLSDKHGETKDEQKKDKKVEKKVEKKEVISKKKKK